MSINLLASTPKSFSLQPADPANPTKQEQAVQEALAAIDAQWIKAGESATKALWRVITRTSDLQGIRDTIKGFGLPITILAAQDAHKTPKLDANGNPVLDVDGNPIMEVKVHDWTTKSTLLKYMSNITIIDPITGKPTGTKPPTDVSIATWGGHEPWVCFK